jgi:hypothetical protein
MQSKIRELENTLSKLEHNKHTFLNTVMSRQIRENTFDNYNKLIYLIEVTENELEALKANENKENMSLERMTKLYNSNNLESKLKVHEHAIINIISKLTSLENTMNEYIKQK